MQGSSGSNSMQGQLPVAQHTQSTVRVHSFVTQAHPQNSVVGHSTWSEMHSSPPLPSQVTGHSPRAPALMHSPRSRPGPNFSLQHLTHSLLPPWAAQATPGMEANAPPTMAAPSNLSALRLERVPVASPLESSSKEWFTFVVVGGLTSEAERSPLFASSLAIGPPPPLVEEERGLGEPRPTLYNASTVASSGY